MTSLFADTFYYLGLLNPSDDQHERVRSFTASYRGTMFTTPWVLTELGDAMARGANRMMFINFINSLQSDPDVTIVPADQELFDRGLDFYARREDKDWSLTDCISFVIMQENGLREALTGDHHFEQAGFVALLK